MFVENVFGVGILLKVPNAQAKDYQLISMSINPLDDFRDGEQYLYILNGSKKRKERVSTFAIFSNADEIQKI